MRKTFLFCLTAPVWLWVCAGMAQTPTAKIVDAANAFIATLDQNQKQSVGFAFDNEEQRKRWSNLPISIVPRKGVSFREMTPPQSAAAMALLGVVLSPRGLEKVRQIMEADEVLKTQQGGRGGSPPNGGPPTGGSGGRGGGRGPGGGLLFGKDLYFISFLGAPSLKDPWLIQFGGHHLALNITISGDRGILTPTLTGAQPALYTANGKVVRPLAGESDKALALLNSLDENQRKLAILSYRAADLVLGPGQDGKTIAAEGLKASAMTERQKTMLLDLVSEWAGIMHETEAAARMAQLKADVNDTWFAWSGNTSAPPGANITAYYRIQGPHLVIEYAPQAMGGDPALHVHTMYRDPTNDYGRSSVAR
jgi:hypothetical protein